MVGMKHLASPLIVLILLLGCAGGLSSGDDPEATSAPAAPTAVLLREGNATAIREDIKIAKSLVRVRCEAKIPSPFGAARGYFSGSGFATGPKTIHTALHVLEADPTVEVIRRFVILPDGKELKIVAYEEIAFDAAKVTLEKAHGLPLLTLADKAPEKWVEALAVGWPELQKSVASSRGAAKAGDPPFEKDWLPKRLLTMALPLMKGMSGGPVVVDGKVVAVVSMNLPGPHTQGALIDKATLAAHAAAREAENDSDDAQDGPGEKADTDDPGASGK